MTRTVRIRLLVMGMLASLVGVYATAQDEPQRVSDELLQALEDARRSVTEVQGELIRSNVYHCCIKPACVFCEFSQGGCPCADLLKKGRGVCTECFGGWYTNQGALDPDTVTYEPNPEGGAARILINGEPLRLMPLSLLQTFYNGRSRALGVDPTQRPQPADADQPTQEEPAKDADEAPGQDQ